MKNLPLGLLFLVVIPSFFLFALSAAVIFSAGFLLSKKDTGIINPKIENSGYKSVYNLFSSPPPVLGAFTSSVSVTDARALTVEQFFSKYHSPLASYGDFFVKTAQKYSIPWELLPAISMQESLGGKNVPDECYNPFGWGINSSGTLCFDNWQQGIETVAKGIKEKYINIGLVTLEQIMSKYNPISYNRDGSWGHGVQYFLSELRAFNTP